MSLSLKPKEQSPVRTAKNLQQQAYNFVKAHIMNRSLKPGQPITDGQIADQLNISRTPVREAFYLLEHEGLLIRQDKRGWKVYSLSLEDITEIFDIKVQLEGLIARRAAECKDEGKRAALKDLVERMKQASACNDHEAWRQADMDLHHVIFDMAGNERASHIINNLNAQWYRLRIGLVAMEGRVERSNREHEGIVSSILIRDGNEAERQMRSHLNDLREELVRVLTHLVFPFVEKGI